MWGQCSPGLQRTVESFESYNDNKDNARWVLEAIKAATTGVNRKHNKHYTLYKALLGFINIRQQQNETNSEYYNRFLANVVQLKMVEGNEILYSAKIIVAQNTTDPNNVHKPTKEDSLKG